MRELIVSVMASPSAALSWVGTVTLWTAGVLAAVRVIDHATRRVLGPRARMSLYALVLVRLALPTDWVAPVGLVGHTRATVAARATATAPLAATSTHAPVVAVPWLSRGPAHEPIARAGAASSAAGSSAAASPSTRWSLAWLVYAAGVAAGLAVAWLRARGLRRVLADTVAAPAEIAALAPGVRVRVHATAGPLAAGLWDRVIVLPRALLDRLATDDLACVVAHEHAHHRGHDPWLAAALRGITAIAWPVVPVWLAAARVRTLLEHAADARAAAGDAAGRRHYGRVLLGLVAVAPPRRRARLEPGLGAYRDLQARIAALLGPAAAPRAVQAVAVAALGATVLACSGLADVPADDSETEATSRDRAAGPDCEALARAATTAHDAAARSASADAFGDVHAAYDRYLGACPDHAEHPELAYYAAEAHWAHATALHGRGDTTAAAEQFTAARRAFDAAIEAGSEFTDDAAYGQHLSVRHATGWARASEAEACEGDGCEPLGLRPYADDDAAVLASWDRYVEIVGRPLPVDAGDILAMAELRMQHNDFAAARPDLEELVTRFEGTPEGLTATEMFVDVLTIAWTAEGISTPQALRRGDELDGWLRRIEGSATVGLAGADRLRAAIAPLRGGIAWKRAEAERAEAEATSTPAAWAACAAAYEQTLALLPDDHAARVDIERAAAECRRHAR